MPEYSSTTITPADGVKTPAMNGSTSGNYTLADLRAFVLASKGLANGLASLDANGKLPTSQLPDLADDVLVYGSYALLPSPGTAGKLYITADDNKMYRWDDALATPAYVELSVDLSDYATKAEVADAVEDLEAADTDLKNALTAIDHRVQNLEQAKGDYVVQSYKDGSITPSGKGAWAVVEGLRGVSRVENQLQNITTASGASWGNGTYSYADGTITINCDASESTINAKVCDLNFSTVSGHSYLVYAPNLPSDFVAYSLNGSFPINEVLPVNFNSTMQLRRYKYGGSASAVTYTSPILVRDLTLYFGGTIPSDADTIAKIQQNYPHLLTPSEYGTSIVDSSYSGVRAWGKNLISGFQVGKDWALLSNPERACFRLDNPSYIGKAMVLSATWPSTVNTIRVVRVRDANVRPNSFVYEEPISIEIVGNVTMTQAIVDECKAQLELGTTATAYSPYMENTLSLTFQGKSAGSVYDSCEPNVEVGGVQKKRETQKVGQVDLGTISWYYDVNYSVFIGTFAGMKFDASNIYNCICSKYLNSGIASATSPDKTFYPRNTGIGIKDSAYTSVGSASDPTTFLGSLQGVYLNYELADPVVTLSDPIIDNTLLTEGGGRLSTVQTGTVVDGSFDMGFINL